MVTLTDSSLKYAMQASGSQEKKLAFIRLLKETEEGRMFLAELWRLGHEYVCHVLEEHFGKKYSEHGLETALFMDRFVECAVALSAALYAANREKLPSISSDIAGEAKKDFTAEENVVRRYRRFRDMSEGWMMDFLGIALRNGMCGAQVLVYIERNAVYDEGSSCLKGIGPLLALAEMLVNSIEEASAPDFWKFIKEELEF